MQDVWEKANAEMVLASEVEILEIIKRAQSGGEVASFLENPETVREEVVRRSAKAGYCNSDGSQRGAGKGDRPRPVDKEKYDRSYERIFGHS